MEYLLVTDDNIADTILLSIPLTTPTFLDIETDGLYTNTRLISLHNPNYSDMCFILDMSQLSTYSVMSSLSKLWLVIYNAPYDLGTLELIPNKIDDLQLLVRGAYPQIGKYDLSTISKILVSKDSYSGLDKKLLQKKGFSMTERLSKEQLEYATEDIKVMPFIWKNELVQLERDKQYYKLDMKVLPLTIKMQSNKALVDMDKVAYELDILTPKLDKSLLDLDGLNCNSPKQVVTKLKEYDSSISSSDADTLITLINTKGTNEELVKISTNVYNTRRYIKRNTYLKGLQPVMRTFFNPYGTVTGRFSSTGGDVTNGINFQNITRDLQYLFKQDSDDTIVVNADYSTAELRAGCSIMGDTQMYKYLMSGIDLHKVSAIIADPTLNLDTMSKEDRTKGKSVSFGLIFGMSSDRFKKYAFTDYGVSFTTEESSNIKTTYNKTYPQITQYHKYWWANYKTQYPTTPLGRRSKPRLGTDAINHATQGSIGEISKLALLIMAKKDMTIFNYLYSQVHDAFYMRVPKDISEKYATIMTDSMIDAWEVLCNGSNAMIFKDIPMLVDYQLGYGSKEKVVQSTFNTQFTLDELLA